MKALPLQGHICQRESLILQENAYLGRSGRRVREKREIRIHDVQVGVVLAGDGVVCVGQSESSSPVVSTGIIGSLEEGICGGLLGDLGLGVLDLVHLFQLLRCLEHAPGGTNHNYLITLLKLKPGVGLRNAT
jgi:hypothetical protein